jgi:hypothetical protein
MQNSIKQIPLKIVERLEPVYLSHSSGTLYEVCPRKYQHRYKQRLESRETSVNLGFGSAIDEGASAFVVGHALGVHVDPVPIFESAYEQFCASHIVAYSTKFESKDDIMAVGRLLLQRFMAKWLETGYVAVLDPDGKPLVQVELKVNLPGSVVFTAIMDVIVITPQGKVLVVDIKTPSQASDVVFHELSNQLTGYQLSVDVHKERLGIDHIDGVAFMELIKRPIPKSNRGAGPEVLTPMEFPVRPLEDIEDFVQSRVWIAEDIRRGRFPKRSLDAYNTPCGDMCEFTNFCTKKTKDGLVVRPPRNQKVDRTQQALEIA